MMNCVFHFFWLSEKLNKLNFFGKQRGFTIKIKTWKTCFVIYSLKNKVLIILVVVHSTEQ